MYLPLKLRIRRARRNAMHLQSQRETSIAEISADLIVELLGPKLVVDYSQGLIVTEAGFITMAVLPEEARYCHGLLVIPGIDDRKQYGYLVVRDGFVPYHSLENSIDEAAADAQSASEKATKLVEHFGGRSELKLAAAAVPWYQLSYFEDACRAGLCRWGVDSFLSRLCMPSVIKKTGMPRFVIRLAGAYGCRVTASTLVRRKSDLSTAYVL